MSTIPIKENMEEQTGSVEMERAFSLNDPFSPESGFDESDEEVTDDGRSNIWTIISLVVLGIMLTWIILGVWRYLQVLSYGSG